MDRTLSEEYRCPGDYGGGCDGTVVIEWERDGPEDGGGSWPAFSGDCPHVEFLNGLSQSGEVGGYHHTWVIGQQVERRALRRVLGIGDEHGRLR